MSIDTERPTGVDADLSRPATLGDIYALMAEVETLRGEVAETLEIARNMGAGVLAFGEQFEAMVSGAQGGILGKLLGVPKGGLPAPPG